MISRSEKYLRIGSLPLKRSRSWSAVTETDLIHAKATPLAMG